METTGKYRVNCFDCTRLKSKLGKRGEHAGWLCTRQGLLNNKEYELPHASPEAVFFRVFGIPLDVSVVTVQDELVACRFVAKSPTNSWGQQSKQLIAIANNGKH